jgi:ABC-type Fe3+ transport system permease subunit
MSSLAFVLTWVVVGLTILVVAMRSGRRTRKRTGADERSALRLTFIGIGVVIVLFGIGGPVLGIVAGSERNTRAPAGVQLSAQEQEGREIFRDQCSRCHILQAAAGVGTVGPDLDRMRPPQALVEDAVRNGRMRGQGNMPAGLVGGQGV